MITSLCCSLRTSGFPIWGGQTDALAPGVECLCSDWPVVLTRYTRYIPQSEWKWPNPNFCYSYVGWIVLTNLTPHSQDTLPVGRMFWSWTALSGRPLDRDAIPLSSWITVRVGEGVLYKWLIQNLFNSSFLPLHSFNHWTFPTHPHVLPNAPLKFAQFMCWFF